MKRLASYGRFVFVVFGLWPWLPGPLAAENNLFITNYSSTIQEITPSGSVSTFATGLSGANCLAFNSSGDLFESDSGTGIIYEFTPSGVRSTFASGLSFPRGLTFDSSGNLYVAAVWSGEVVKYTPSGQASIFASGLSYPETMAFDANGNMYEADSGSDNIYKFTPSGVRSTFASGGFSLLDGSIAFGPNGNLYVGDSGAGIVYEITPSGQRSVFASGFPSVALGCLTFDNSGNLFVAGGPSGSIYEFTPSGSRSTYASGFSAPDGLAFAPTSTLRPATYNLTAAVSAATIHVGGTTTVTATITNAGASQADMLNYTGLTLTPSAALSGTGLPKSGGPLAVGTSDWGSQTFNPSAAGAYTFTPTVTSVTNATLGTSATGATTGVTVDVFSGSAKWASSSGTAWGAAGNWTDTATPSIQAAPGTFTGFNADEAIFDGSGTAATVNLNTPVALGALVLGTSGALTGYTIAGSNSLTLTNGSVSVSSGAHTISAPVVLAGSLAVSMTGGASLNLSGSVGESVLGSSLSLSGGGQLILSGPDSYSGGTTVSGGTLQGTTTSLQGSITNNATLVFNQATDATYAGTINGTGLVGKSGSAQLTFSSINVTSGPIAVNQGTLVLPSGLAGGGPLSVSSGATLQATGLIGRAVTGAGTVTATGDLYVGNSKQAGQFNQGGAPGVAGTLNVGSNAVFLVQSDTAILGSQTNLSAGGSLTTLNGAQLGNPTSQDTSKVLTATGNATINGNFVNNGIVNGPTGTGQELKFTQAVQGAGSTTGNIEYAGSYQVGNSPDAVSVQNVLFDPTSTLIMEFAGDAPGSGYDQLDISGTATLNGTLDLSYLDGFTPSTGEVFNLFNGQTTGSFSQVILPSMGNGLSWNTSNLDTNGTITVTPEPSSFALLAAAGAVGLVGYGLRKRRVARRTAKPEAFDQQGIKEGKEGIKEGIKKG